MEENKFVIIERKIKLSTGEEIVVYGQNELVWSIRGYVKLKPTIVSNLFNKDECIVVRCDLNDTIYTIKSDLIQTVAEKIIYTYDINEPFANIRGFIYSDNKVVDVLGDINSIEVSEEL